MAWVEGFSGAGKSDFAAKLAARLHWRHVELDGLVRGDPIESAEYVDHVDPTKLDRALGTSQTPDALVVDGVCLRDVVGHMAALAPPLKLYVARVTRVSDRYHWHDGIEMEDLPTDLRWLERSILNYHLRIAPHIDADHAFLRVANVT